MLLLCLQVTVQSSHADFADSLATELQNRVLHTAGVLGLASDVSTATLLDNARRFGLGSYGNARAAAAQQANADIEALHSVLHQAWLPPAHLPRCPP